MEKYETQFNNALARTIAKYGYISLTGIVNSKFKSQKLESLKIKKMKKKDI